MKRLFLVFMMSVFWVIGSAFASAQTYDIGVLGHLERCTDFYSYLNNYHYRIWREDNRYSAHHMYINSDDAVITSFFNGRLDAIFILKDGYSTDQGIKVGMTKSDVYRVYGSPDGLTGHGSKGYSGYQSIEYVSAQNEGLSFVFDGDDRVVLIRYQQNRHGNTTVMMDVASYGLLPHLY